MRKFWCVALTIALSAVGVYLCSCVGGGAIDTTDPITPSPEIKEGVVDPGTRLISITRDDVTVAVEHWSRYRLDHKYTTVDMRSPFYYLGDWKQSFQSEVFHVTIKNDTPKNVLVNFDETTINDDRDYLNKYQNMAFFDYKFSLKRMMDLRTKKSLATASRILLSEVLGPKRIVPPGRTLSGFIPFPTPSSGATKVWVTLVLNKEPEAARGSYERVEFRFDFVQDLIRRAKQPSTKR